MSTADALLEVAEAIKWGALVIAAGIFFSMMLFGD